MKKTSLIWVLFTLLAITGCDVHELPDIPSETQFTLYLDFDTEMPLYKEMEQRKARSINSDNAYDVRHILSVHRLHSDGGYDRRPDTLIVFTCDDAENLNCSREFTLREGEYNFFVWTDFVNEGSQSDKFYNATDFSEIILKDKNNYTGSTDYRDAFRGMEQASVIVRKDEIVEVSNEATVTMKRPLAKFKFISNDYDVFVENALKAEARKTKNATSETGTDTEPRSINLADYRVVFRYIGFMPCSYNMFTDRPADAWTGVSFEGSLKPMDNQEVELGFDYVFVNGSETGVSVILEVYHKDGELIASTPSIDVPLVRSKLTVIKGSFLSSIAEGGVGINPDFDGEYNVEIK